MAPPSPSPLFPLPSAIRNLKPPTPSPTSHAHFLNLPLEIRNSIYTYVLESESEYPVPITTDQTPEEDEADPECDIRGPYSLPRVRGSTFARVNRQVHSEVMDLMARKRRLKQSNQPESSTPEQPAAYKCEITLKNEAYFYPVWTRIPSFLPFQLQSASTSNPPPSSTTLSPDIPLGTLQTLNLTLHIRGSNQHRTFPNHLMSPFYSNGLDPPRPIWSLWYIIKDILTCGPALVLSRPDARHNGVRIGTLSLNVLTPPPSALPDGLPILPVEGFRELRGIRRDGVINPRSVAGELVEYTEWLWGEGGYPDGDYVGKLFVERMDVFRVCVDGVVLKEWDVKEIRGRGRKK